MSIVTLKKKSRALHTSHSTPDGFSLNGRVRLMGIGEHLGRSVTRTPFAGIGPKGHGGGARCRVGGMHARATKCGGGPFHDVVSNSGSCHTPQTRIKKSSMTTSGMLAVRYCPLYYECPGTPLNQLPNEVAQHLHAAQVIDCPQVGPQKDRPCTVTKSLGPSTEKRLARILCFQ